MDIRVERFREQWQSELLSLHSEHEDNVNALVKYIDNELDLDDEQREKIWELIDNVNGTLENLKLEIL
jgi:hypothetical protein